MGEILENHSPEGDLSWDKKTIKKETKKLLDEVYEYTKLLYADGTKSVLIILQGMDASGKDGLTRSLFKKVSPAWVNVHSFKKPTEIELRHDFLWRIHQCAPKKGMVTVFNRSHYEDILIPTVYNTADKSTIEKRYQQINNFEKHLEENGTKIIKCYLNVGYEKQKSKLLDRINTPSKHWKHSDGDWETRKKWVEFINAYETVFERCNKVPWNFIPSNYNWAKTYATAVLYIKTLKEMKLEYPQLDSKQFIPKYKK